MVDMSTKFLFNRDLEHLIADGLKNGISASHIRETVEIALVFADLPKARHARETAPSSSHLPKPVENNPPAFTSRRFGDRD